MVMVKPKTGMKSSVRSGSVKFQYKARTPEQVRERAQKQIGGRDSYFTSDVQFFTPREGDNNIRILPPPPDVNWGHYGIGIVVHYAIGSDQSAYLCTARMKDEPCPICEERDRATSSGEEDLADSLRPSFRTAVMVIDRAQEGKGPLLWNIAAGLDKDITKLCIDPASGEILPVDHPEDGYDLNFTREGQGMKTKYKGIQFSRKSSPLSDDSDQAEAWLKQVVDHPIDSCFQYYDYDHISKVFAGQAPATTDDSDEKPVKKTAPKSTDKKGSAVKPKIQVRTSKKEEPEEKSDLPTPEELEEMDEDALVALGEEKELQFPESFDSIEELRTFIGTELGIIVDEEAEQEKEEEEEEEKKEPAKANWRDRLKAKTGKK